jgi:hypothetical protein
MTVSLNHLGDLARKRVAVAAYYFVPGVVFASWASRIPDVKQMLHLSNGQLGTVLFAIPIGQLLMMAFSGVLVCKIRVLPVPWPLFILQPIRWLPFLVLSSVYGIISVEH